MNLKAVASVTWAASLAHLLVLFNRLNAVSPGTVALVVTGLLTTIPMLWLSSAVLLAPGALHAAVALAFGQGHGDPVSTTVPTPTPKQAIAKHGTGHNGSADGTGAMEESAGGGVALRVPAGTAGGSGQSTVDEAVSPNANVTAVWDENADDAASWRDAVIGIKGMAQALHDANNHVSVVALNADLTVSLSTMMLNTLSLFEASSGGFGDDGKNLPQNHKTFQPQNVAHLENAKKIVTDTCALAEPLFDKDTPLVVHNNLDDEMCFLSRDTFACCLFALVYRASARVVSGACVLSAEAKTFSSGFDEKGEKDSQTSSDGVTGINSPRVTPSKHSVLHPLGPATGVCVTVEYLRAVETHSARESAGEGPSDSTWAHLEDTGTCFDPKRPRSAEMQFWRRRLRSLGGSLSVTYVPGAGVGTEIEKVSLWVPTKGSDTFAFASVDKPTESFPTEKNELFGPGAPRGSGDAPSFPFPEYDGTTSRSSSGSRTVTSGSDGAPPGTRATQPHTFRPSDRPAYPGAGQTTTTTRPPRLSTAGSHSFHDSMSSSFHDSLYDSYVSTITTDFSILYIEDERVQAYFFINKCRRVFGDRCHVAHETDGVGALARLKNGQQFSVVVSDIFMAGMDGVSFFHTLFDADLNQGLSGGEGTIEGMGDCGVGVANDGGVASHGANGGSAARRGGRKPPPRLNIILTGADVDPSRGEDDAELAFDLNDLQEKHGVLCYNKTSAVDVVLDVIKPHVAFLERSLNRSHRTSGGGVGHDGFTETGDRMTGYRVDEELVDDLTDALNDALTDERDLWLPPPRRGSVFGGNGDGDGDDDHSHGNDDAFNLVARSGRSVGAFGVVFPDTEALARAGDDEGLAGDGRG